MMVNAKELTSARRVARMVKRCLDRGAVVEIDRFGTFVPKSAGEYEFSPSIAPRVFVAYVEEDLDSAQRIYNALKDAGFDTWMDRQNLLPGQNWPRAIERAIEISDFFVACLSPQSVCKRGTFQHEMRWAMDAARRLPLDDVFFVPVRLTPCAVPRRIQQQWQYVDLFPRLDRGLSKLIAVMKKEWERRRHST